MAETVSRRVRHEWKVLRDALSHRAEANSERLAFASGEESVTFAQLADRAELRAASFQSTGVGPGTRVALAMSAGLPLVEVFWGLQLVGAVPCVFNPHAPRVTVEQRIKRIKPGLVVTDELAAQTPSAGRREREPTQVGSDDLAFLQLTSGTSGEPRASLIRHRNVMACQGQSQGLVEPDDVLVCWVPPWHDLGLVRFVIGPVYHGVSCHLVAPAVRTIPQWLGVISEVGGTWSGAPDFAYRLAARMVAPGSVDLSSLRFAANGGEPVRWSSIQEFEERFSVPGVVKPGYGLGEATLTVSCNLPGEEVHVDERGNVSCGSPMPGLEVLAGFRVEEPAEIRVRGGSVFGGYFEAPDETASVLRDGWLHTGDMGYRDGDGRLFVLGRRQAMIKRAGAAIAPRELEEAAQRVVGVRLAAATTLAPGELGEAPIVVAVEADRGGALSDDELAATVSREIIAAVGFAPDRVTVVAPRTIPRTENGKVRYDALPNALSGAVAS